MPVPPTGHSVDPLELDSVDGKDEKTFIDVAEVLPEILPEAPEALDFTSRATLPRKAGVSSEADLLPLVVKELLDNALDATEAAEGGDVALVSAGLLEGRNGFFVEDGAGGFSPEMLRQVWRVDSTNVSSKRLRLPTRGALGNGLRVVSGTVMAYRAILTVHTRGKAYEIQPRYRVNPRVTEPLVLETGDSPLSQGTRIEIVFPEDEVVVDEDVLEFVDTTLFLSANGFYKGASSPHWYTANDFFKEILQRENGKTVQEVVARFDGCSASDKVSRISDGFRRMIASEVPVEDADVILARMKDVAPAFNPKRLTPDKEPKIEGEHRAVGAYVTESGLTIPFRVSVWAEPSDTPRLDFAINRTVSTGGAYIDRKDNNTLRLVFPKYVALDVTSQKNIAFLVNISAPLIPYTNDGKSPNVWKIVDTDVVKTTITKAAKAAKGRAKTPRKGRTTQKDAILKALPEALRRAGGGMYAFSQRQVYYSIRPLLAFDLKYDTFCKNLTLFEQIHGEIENLYRDNRGTLVLPHSRKEMPVGTVNVKRFERPEWEFHRVLYAEKEGLFPLLLSANWPERWDCALLTSKGFASRAAKDLIDALGEGDEPLELFCIHDADAAGTMIYQSLVEATPTRGARKIEIHNLGLEPWEALFEWKYIEGNNGEPLPEETLERESGAKKKAVARYASEWEDWLQGHRVELNAMTAPQLIAWLDRKMEAVTRMPPKLIPPEDVVRSKYEKDMGSIAGEEIKALILDAAGFDERVAVVVEEGMSDYDSIDVRGLIEGELSQEERRAKSWEEPVREVVAEVVEALALSKEKLRLHLGKVS